MADSVPCDYTLRRVHVFSPLLRSCLHLVDVFAALTRQSPVPTPGTVRVMRSHAHGLDGKWEECLEEAQRMSAVAFWLRASKASKVSVDNLAARCLCVLKRL